MARVSEYLTRSVSKDKEKHEGRHESRHKSAKHKVHEMHIKHGHEGGFIVRHSGHPEDMMERGETKEYPIKNEAHLIKHVKEHMCSGKESEGEEEKGEMR